MQFRCNSITTPVQFRYNSGTNPEQLRYNFGTTPSQLRYNSGTNPEQLRYNFGTTPSQLRYNSGTTPVQFRYNSGTTPVQLRYNDRSFHSFFKESIHPLRCKLPNFSRNVLLINILVRIFSFATFIVYLCISILISDTIDLRSFEHLKIL